MEGDWEGGEGKGRGWGGEGKGWEGRSAPPPFASAPPVGCGWQRDCQCAITSDRETL